MQHLPVISRLCGYDFTETKRNKKCNNDSDPIVGGNIFARATIHCSRGGKTNKMKENVERRQIREEIRNFREIFNMFARNFLVQILQVESTTGRPNRSVFAWNCNVTRLWCAYISSCSRNIFPLYLKSHWRGYTPFRGYRSFRTINRYR